MDESTELYVDLSLVITFTVSEYTFYIHPLQRFMILGLKSEETISKVLDLSTDVKYTMLHVHLSYGCTVVYLSKNAFCHSTLNI